MENPKIRFKGFTKDWEQRKLIDYLEVSSEKNRDNRFTKEDVLSVSGEYGIVNQIEFQGRSFAGASVSNYGVVENGDVVYTKSPLKSNPYGIIKTNKGIPGIVSTLYAVYKPKEITDSKFVQIYFELDSRMNSYMHPLVNKGAKNDMKVSAENALKGMVSFPKKDEQEMISLYFSTIDHLITLHQRKCEQTKKLKKYMLQKMFPQNGAKVPEIRFYGFTYDWEQRKLNEVGVVIDPHPSHRAPKEEQGGIPFIGIGDVDEMGNINRESARPVPENVYDEHHKRYDLNVPSLGLGRVASLGKVIRLRSDIGKYAISPTISVLQFSENINIDYLYAYMNTPQFKKQFEGKSNGSTRQSVGTEMVRLLNLSMPFNLDEQKAIGTFYKNLDNLITLHQRKCDELKKMKKYMLQNMFI